MICTRLPVLGITLIVSGAAAFAQDSAKRDMVAPAPHYLKVTEVVGAKVQQSVDPRDTKLGEVKDVIIDTSATLGHGAFAVLSDGELFTLANDRIHGISCLRWEGGKRQFVLDQTAVVDTSMPAHKTAKDAADATGDRAKDLAVDAGARGRATPSRLLMWSGIKGLHVYPQGSKDSFGKVEDLWIDTTRGCTGFLVVSSGGVLGVGDTTRLIPWNAATIERAASGKDNQVRVNAAKEVLEAAPKIEAKTDANDPALRAQACKGFNCTDPALDPTKQHAR